MTPDRLDACWKRRQVAEIQPAFADAMEIGAARRLEAVATRERREFGELRRRMRRRDNFERVAAEVAKFGDQRTQPDAVSL